MRALPGLLLCFGLGAEDPGPPRIPEGIRTILVVPALNRTVDVTAPDQCLPYLTRPLSQRGYYVLPMWTVKRILEEEGLADAGLVHHTDPRRLGERFGADAVLLPTIHYWEAKFFVLGTRTVVEVAFRLVSTRTGEELWQGRKQVAVGSGGRDCGNPGVTLAVMLVGAAIAKTSPGFRPLVRQVAQDTLCSALPPPR